MMNATHAATRRPRPWRLVVLAVLAFGLVLAAPAAAADLLPDPPEEEARRRAAAAGLSLEQWKAFSDNVAVALDSGHDGLRQGAMRLLIQYRGQLWVDREGVHDLMRIYRDHDNLRMRQMAVVTLGEIEDRWAMRFFERAVQFEREPVIQNTMRAVLAEYHARNTVEVGEPRLADDSRYP